MNKLRNNQSGIAHMAIPLIIVVIAVVGLVGWKVRQNQNNKKSANTTVPQSTIADTQPTNDKSVEKIADETASWLLYSSKNNAYKIRLADGLVFEKAEPDTQWLSLSTYSLVTKAGTKAQVITGKGGRDGVMGMYINYYETGTGTKGFGDKQSSFKTNSGLNVDKYLYVQRTEPDGIGLEKGGKEYNYAITNADGRADLIITYSLAPTDEGNTALVEKMVKTVEMQ